MIKKTILIIIHRPSSQIGRVGFLLTDMGFNLDIRCCAQNDPLPTTLQNYAGVITFGGPMSVNDSLDFIKKECKWLEIPLREQIPFLGICLGAQLLVKHLGGHITRLGDRIMEIGWTPFIPTHSSHHLSFPNMVFNYHNEEFSLPKDCVLLGTDIKGSPRAFSYANHCLAVQFHPELTDEMAVQWSNRSVNLRDKYDNIPSPGKQLQDRKIYDAALYEWLKISLTQLFVYKTITSQTTRITS